MKSRHAEKKTLSRICRNDQSRWSNSNIGKRNQWHATTKWKSRGRNFYSLSRERDLCFIFVGKNKLHRYETEIDSYKTTINELEDQIAEYKIQIDDLTKMMQETQVEVSDCISWLRMKQHGFSLEDNWCANRRWYSRQISFSSFWDFHFVLGMKTEENEQQTEETIVSNQVEVENVRLVTSPVSVSSSD